MKNIHDVLRQKELELENVQREIDALRLAVRLCSDPGEIDRSVAASASAESGSPKPVRSVAPSTPDKALKQFP